MVGHHLLRVPVTGGVAAVSLNGNVSVSATNKIPYGAFGGYYYQNNYSGNNPTGAKSIGSVSATANIDSRDVNVHSNLGQTNHASFTFDGNGFALPEPDPPGFATTVVPYLESADVGGTTGVTGGAIRYMATPTGSWGPNSSYRWQSRIGNMYVSTQSPNGTFTLPNDPPYDLVLTYLSKKDGGNVSAGDTEHITITLTDSSSGDALSAPYDVAFHDPTEDWELWDKGNPFWQGATADTVADPGYALHNAGITATWTYTDTFWAG